MTDVTQGSSDATELAVAQAAQGGIRGRRPLADLVKDNLGEIEKALPPGIMDAERFNRIVLTELRRTPKLLVCTPESFFGALFQTAQLGLEPGGSLGHAFLIPYENRKADVTECQLQIGYKGYVELAGRRGILIRAREVREDDDFDFDLGSREYLHHSYKLRASVSRVDQEVIGYYGKVVMPDGTTTFHVMDKSEINKRRDRSSAVRSGRTTPWDTDYDAMARKTIIRAMVPQIALAPDLQIALKADEAVVQRADSGDLSYLYRDSIDVTPPPTGPSREELSDALNAMEDTHERLAASKYLLDNFGQFDSVSDDMILPMLTIVQEWPAVLGRADRGDEALAKAKVLQARWDAIPDITKGVIEEIDDGERQTAATLYAEQYMDEHPGALDEQVAHAVTLFANALLEAPEAPQEPFDIESGLDHQDVPVDEAVPADEAAQTDLMRDTARQINAWPIDTVKRVLRERELSTSGTHETLRTRLLSVLAPARARGDKAATDLFV